MKSILNILGGALLSFFCACSPVNKQSYVHELTAEADTNVVLPPSWAFGMMYGAYTNQEQTIKRVDEIISHGYPIDAYWIDSWFWSHADQGKGPHKFMDFVADTVGYPNREAMWDYLQKYNIKGGFWAWDCIFKTGNEEAFEDFLSKGFFRNTYVESNPWHNNSTTTAMFQTEGGDKKGTLCGNIDFKNPEAVAYFKQKMKHFFDEGADFIKLDRTSAIPVCKVMFEMAQEFGKETKGRGFILSHTGGMETEEYKRYPGKWTDDTRSDWNIEKPTKNFNSWVPSIALKENIAMFTDPKYNRSCEIPFLTNDLGGFDMGITDKVDEELFIRWLQFSIFTPMVEVFAQPENYTANMAYNYSEKADSIFRKYTHWRMELFPYIYSYAHKVRLESKQMMRTIPGQTFEYMFGDEMFIAPIYEQGATTREVLLPEGKWVNYWNNDVLEGKKCHTINYEIDQIPLFIKEGSIIPMRNYARSIEQGTNDTLTLHIYPGVDSEFTLIEDDGTSNDYLKGIYAKTRISSKITGQGFKIIVDPVLGDYVGMSKKRTICLYIHTQSVVSKVECNGSTIDHIIKNNGVVSAYVTADKNIETEFVVSY